MGSSPTLSPIVLSLEVLKHHQSDAAFPRRGVVFPIQVLGRSIVQERCVLVGFSKDEFEKIWRRFDRDLEFGVFEDVLNMMISMDCAVNLEVIG